MHSGLLRGGKRGVTRAGFLAFLKPELVSVLDEANETRGIVIGQLGKEDLSDRIGAFVQKAASYKIAVGNGDTGDRGYQVLENEWRDYLSEFSGRKTGRVDVNLDYVSYHGDVVDALKLWVESDLDTGFVVTNSRTIDLLVHEGKNLLSVYEVKTSTARQALYTAIGQLIVHSATASESKRYLVLPQDEAIPDDIAKALKAWGVTIYKFFIDRDQRVNIRA